MVKRNKLGQFEPLTPGECKSDSSNFLIDKLPKLWINKLVYVVVLMLMISPWIFIALRKNSITKITQSVTEFYDDTFSCNCESICNLNMTIPQAPKKGIF